MERRGQRRSVTLSEQLAMVESTKLRELLKAKDEDDMRPSIAVAACEKRAASSGVGCGAGGGRTLLDIMREDQEANEDAMGGNSGNGMNWKSVADRFRLRRAGNACAAAAASSVQPNSICYPEFIVSSGPNPVLVRPVTRSISGRNSQLPASASIAPEYNPATTGAAALAASSPPDTHPSGGAAVEATTGAQESSDLGSTSQVPASVTTAAEEEQPARVSLMALLEQTDRHWSSGGEGTSPAALGMLDALEPVAEDIGGGGILHVCCICMVRQKGAAFIPCGHTFCRRCSRELWVSRGSCPICNAFILEILDIF
ncbi:hypothetical protein Cni_G13123 [Canna indica]|uniref:RING-type domain-containing protein n=1 Tax=Canna indica TaxID=4628 RepID=A0AAQ3K910_9LILI|nr:hypothetical protein Cni_G13123 [Canna indica]